MYAIALKGRSASEHINLLTAMYRLRRRVFKERLDWNVTSSGEFEIDIYDTLDPTYLLVVSAGGEVLGCVRLLSTMGPTMVADVFPYLLGGQPPPRNPQILESSRFCVDTELAGKHSETGLNRATFFLFAAMIEAMRVENARSIITVTDARMERILRRAGWPLLRINSPRQVGQTMALAGFLYDSEDALAEMYQRAGVVGPVLVDPRSILTLH